MVKKIDFHIHTVSTEKDYDFQYSSEWIENYVSKSKLDAIAITNHDLFDLRNFNFVKGDLPNCTVFPGIELSLEGGHVNIVFSEEEKYYLSEFSDWLNNNLSGSKKSISVDEYCENMKNWENGIYIFEMGKSNSMQVPERFKNSCCVGGVSNQLRFQSFYKKEEGLTPVLFSDAHATDCDSEKNRNNIEFLCTKNTFLQIDNCTFNEIKNTITDKTKVDINIENLRDVIDVGGHRVSTGLNLIVGKRGTGKTYLLQEIKNCFEEKDIYEIKQFETAKSDDYIEKQRIKQGESAASMWSDKYQHQLSAIKDFLTNYDSNNILEIDDYLNGVKKFAKDWVMSKSTSKYNLYTQQNFEGKPTKNIEEHLNDLKKLINSRDVWSMISDSSMKRKIFIEVYSELRLIYCKYCVTNHLQNKVNEILDTIKEYVNSKTGITPIPECRFADVVKDLQRKNEINKFMKQVIRETELKRERIHGYQIQVDLVPFNNAEQFRSDIKTSEAVKDEIILPYQQKNYLEFLLKLSKRSFYEPERLAKYLMHLEVKLLDSEGIPASGGQAVGFALMMRLDEAKNKPVILIDEPEASLDNAYIREELINAIRELSKESMVFVVTHNSTLGTLLDPDYLIVTTKEDSTGYRVLTGEFSSKIISKEPGAPEYSYEKFVEAMEAGITTYQKKGEVYESLRNK